MKRIVATLVLDFGVPDMDHYKGCKTIEEAAAQDQQDFDDGKFGAEDLFGMCEESEVKFEVVETP